MLKKKTATICNNFLLQPHISQTHTLSGAYNFPENLQCHIKNKINDGKTWFYFFMFHFKIILGGFLYPAGSWKSNNSHCAHENKVLCFLVVVVVIVVEFLLFVLVCFILIFYDKVNKVLLCLSSKNILQKLLKHKKNPTCWKHNINNHIYPFHFNMKWFTGYKFCKS